MPDLIYQQHQQPPLHFDFTKNSYKPKQSITNKSSISNEYDNIYARKNMNEIPIANNNLSNTSNMSKSVSSLYAANNSTLTSNSIKQTITNCKR